MRAELVALAGVEGALQQGAEDCGFHIAPVLLGGVDQEGELNLRDGQRLRVAEEAAVEALEVGHQAFGEGALVHRLPQAAQGGFRVLGMAAKALQEAGEAAGRDQLHVFSEHGEEAAHEEMRHVLRGVALPVEGAPKSGQPLSHFAGHLGGHLRRVERVRVGPDRTEAGLHLLFPQVIHCDSVARAVGKLGVSLPDTREVGPYLDDVAHVHDQQEWRPAILACDCAGVAVRLPPGTQHGVVPLGSATDAVPFALGRWQVGQ